jgi:ubiquinone biosynthesis protein
MHSAKSHMIASGSEGLMAHRVPSRLSLDVLGAGLEIVERPDALDEERLRRTLGRFLARHVATGVTPDASMFTDLFRIVSDHGLAIPPEIAAVFRT